MWVERFECNDFDSYDLCILQNSYYFYLSDSAKTADMVSATKMAKITEKPETKESAEMVVIIEISKWTVRL